MKTEIVFKNADLEIRSVSDPCMTGKTMMTPYVNGERFDNAVFGSMADGKKKCNIRIVIEEL